MKAICVTVRFPHGLHARTAASVVRLFKQFRCRVLLCVGNRAASAKSILNILLLAAAVNTTLEIRASGEDEESAVRAAEVFFQNDDETAVEQLTFVPVPDKPPPKRP